MPITLDTSDLEAKLKGMAARLAAREPAAVSAGAEIIRREIENRAPVGHGYPGAGKLKRNIIKTEPEKGKDGRYYVRTGPRMGGKDDPYYARFKEFGTTKMSAEPFVEPAFLSKKNEALEAMAEAMRE